jgi:hypothetical protein
LGLAFALLLLCSARNRAGDDPKGEEDVRTRIQGVECGSCALGRCSHLRGPVVAYLSRRWLGIGSMFDHGFEFLWLPLVSQMRLHYGATSRSQR